MKINHPVIGFPDFLDRILTGKTIEDEPDSATTYSDDRDHATFGLEFTSQLLARQVRPAVLLSPSGRVKAANKPAMQSLGIKTDTAFASYFEDCPADETLLDILRGLAKLSHEDDLSYHKVRSNSEASFFISAFAVEPDRKRFSDIIVVCLSDQISDATWQKLADTYILSASEVGVLREFTIQGNLKSIAAQRNRSVTTVRKQFYSAMDKLGLKSQTELVREILLHEYQFDADVEQAAAVGFPNRRELTVLRPSGRFAEVYMAGDPDGQPVVLLAIPGIRRYGAEMERRFLDAGITFLGLSRPGFGGTSAPPDSESYAECLAADYAALLDQLGRKSAVIYAPASGFYDALMINRLCPGRVSRVLTTTPYLPEPILPSTRPSTIFKKCMAALSRSPRVRQLSIEAFSRLYWMASTKQFLRVVYGRQAAEAVAVFEKSGFLPEVEEAMSKGFSNGTTPILQEYDRLARDWNALLDCTHLPVTVYEARAGGLVDLRRVKQYVQYRPAQAELVLIDAVTVTHVHKFPDRMIEVLQRCLSGASFNSSDLSVWKPPR